MKLCLSLPRERTFTTPQGVVMNPSEGGSTRPRPQGNIGLGHPNGTQTRQGPRLCSGARTVQP